MNSEMYIDPVMHFTTSIIDCPFFYWCLIRKIQFFFLTIVTNTSRINAEQEELVLHLHNRFLSDPDKK